MAKKNYKDILDVAIDSVEDMAEEIIPQPVETQQSGYKVVYDNNGKVVSSTPV